MYIRHSLSRGNLKFFKYVAARLVYIFLSRVLYMPHTRELFFTLYDRSFAAYIRVIYTSESEEYEARVCNNGQ